jgi:hypothetical protein
MASVTAIVVTRGDVDMQPVLSSLPDKWEVLVWDNGAGRLTRWFKNDGVDNGEQYEPFWQFDMSVKPEPVADLSVYGRYAAIEYASHDIVYVQDDDVIVSDPQAIVEQWKAVLANTPQVDNRGDFVVCNMPQEFRHDFYVDHALVGFGAAFHRDAPERAFAKFTGSDTGYLITRDYLHLHRCCDIMFTGLTPRVLVDVPKTDLEYASDPNRMWKQPEHQGERQRMLDLVRSIR